MKHSPDKAWKLMTKTKKLLTNNEEGLSANIKAGGQEPKVVRQYKYLGLIISEEASEREIISRAVQRKAPATKLKTILKDKNICHNQRSMC